MNEGTKKRGANLKFESCNAIKLILIGVQFLFLVMAFELSFERKREPALLSLSACIQIQDKFGIICLVIFYMWTLNFLVILYVDFLKNAGQ